MPKSEHEPDHTSEQMSESEVALEVSHAQLRPLDIHVDDGVLRSERFDDIFFSNEDGLKESCYVFLEGTELAQKLLTSTHITIAETGFGTGLNLAATMQLMHKLGINTKLDYISFEACPLTDELIEVAHQKFPEVTDFSKEIRSVLPPRWPGTHLRHLMDGQIQLHLHYGIADTLMPRHEFQADIWFLDGFTPAKNADLWSPKLCSEVARLSAPGARIATFTVAALARNGLSEAGFILDKRPGFGRKRDMLVGHLPDKHANDKPIPKKVAVLGGGIAGASICAGLTQVGIDHVLIDPAPILASGASGNPLGLQIPRLRVVDHPISRLSVSAFSTACDIANTAGALISTGAIALDMPEREAVRHDKLTSQGWPTDLLHPLSADEMTRHVGMDLGMGGVYYPLAQVVSPQKLTQHLAKDSQVILGHGITTIRQTEVDLWVIELSDGRDIEADHLILAAGAGLPDLLEMLELPELPLQITSGQLTYFPQDNQGSSLKTALNYGGYMAQGADGRLVAGASFDRSASMELSDAAHDHNISLMPQNLAQTMSKDGLEGRVSRRLATTDRWPLMGRYAAGVSIFSALSATGLTLAPLLGHVHARQLAQKPTIIDADIIRVLDPMRFAKRAAKRR